MLEGYFRAGSAIRDEEALGGFEGSNNFPRELDRKLTPDTLSLVALPEEALPFSPGVAGFRVILANTTSRVLAFEASDSVLNVLREALDADGDWKPIEHLPQSFCGNSFHRVYLQPGHQWTFVAPVYHGPFETKMRFVLFRGQEPPLYSNEFSGFIDLQQFVPPPDPHAMVPTIPAGSI
jgi:hypothetical protein